MISRNKRTISDDQEPENEESQILNRQKTKTLLEWLYRIDPKPRVPFPKHLLPQDYESIVKSGESAYNYQFDFNQKILVLQKKLICSHQLNCESFDNSEENITFYFALKKVKEIYKNLIQLMDSGKKRLNIRGSSGVGKT